MSWVHQKIDAHRDLSGRQRDFADQVVEAFKALLDPSQSPTSGPSPLSIIGGSSAHIVLPYLMVIDPNSHLFPDGERVLFGQACRIIACSVTADPNVTASAATTFKLQNKKTSPSSSGLVTVQSGKRVGYNDALAIDFSADQKLYIVAPAALHGLQSLFFHLEAIPT